MSRLPPKKSSSGTIPRTGSATSSATRLSVSRQPPAGSTTSSATRLGASRQPPTLSRTGSSTTSSATRLAASRQPPAIPSTSSGVRRTSLRPPPIGTKEIASKTRVTMKTPSGETKTSVKADRSVLPKTAASGTRPKIGAPVGRPTSQAAVPIPPPSVLRKQVSLQVKGSAARAPMGSKVTAVAAKRTRAPPLEKILTPSGPQQVIQKVITENRMERSRMGEIVSQNIKTIEMDPTTGETTQLEEEVQKLNPNFPTTSRGPVKEIVAIVSEKNVTSNYETVNENFVHETSKLDQGIGIDLNQVSQLVEEEKEDVENALNINPPDLEKSFPERFPMKKKLQSLRLAPENIVVLQNIVIKPAITADDPLPETTPEVMSKVMNALDKSVQSKLDPETTFNTLFTEGGASEPQQTMMNISSIAPGPLEDIVVPTEAIPEITHEEMLSKRMEESSAVVQTATNKPTDSSFSEKAPAKPIKRGRKVSKYKMLTEEDPPWGKEDLPEVSKLVGAFPKENLDTTDVHEKTISGDLNTEIDKGIEFYLDCNTLQYCSRVQLRGSQSPPWFPGYIFAVSDMDNVEVAKSPSQVLYSAWRSVQPEVFPEDSIVYN